MPAMPPTFRPGGPRSRREVRADHERKRATPVERGYDSKWRKASTRHLADNPLCAYCALDGRVVAASLVDHLYPHRWFAGIFWLTHWWVSSCRPCHDGMKQRVERAGRAAIDRLAARLGRPLMDAEAGGAG